MSWHAFSWGSPAGRLLSAPASQQRFSSRGRVEGIPIFVEIEEGRLTRPDGGTRSEASVLDDFAESTPVGMDEIEGSLLFFWRLFGVDAFGKAEKGEPRPVWGDGGTEVVTVGFVGGKLPLTRAVKVASPETPGVRSVALPDDEAFAQFAEGFLSLLSRRFRNFERRRVGRLPPPRKPKPKRPPSSFLIPRG